VDARPRCTAQKADGSPCRAAALPGKEHCLFHDPERAAERDAARSRGGRASHKPPAVVADAEDVAFTTVPDVVRFLAATASQVRRGELDCRLGNCLTYIAATALRAIQPDDTARQVAELKAQVEEIRRAYDGDPPGDGGPAAGAGAAPGGARPAPPGDEGGPGAADDGGEPDAGPLAGGPAADLATPGLTPLFPAEW
jgi:hypothetical protein